MWDMKKNNVVEIECFDKWASPNLMAQGLINVIEVDKGSIRRLAIH